MASLEPAPLPQPGGIRSLIHHVRVPSMPNLHHLAQAARNGVS
jgi:hypothetical protein